MSLVFFFFFFSSRRRHTRLQGDWSSDVCSSDLHSAKVRAIGHGIDMAALSCVPERRPPLRRLLGLGRYAPVKGWETVLRALTALPEATFTLHGPMLTDADRTHRPQLETLAGTLGVGDRVTFGADVA